MTMKRPFRQPFKPRCVVEHGLLDKLVADNSEPNIAYADWLEECGEVWRALFLRSIGNFETLGDEWVYIVSGLSRNNIIFDPQEYRMDAYGNLNRCTFFNCQSPPTSGKTRCQTHFAQPGPLSPPRSDDEPSIPTTANRMPYRPGK